MCEAVNFVIRSAHSNMDFVNLDVFIFPLGFGVFPFIFSKIYMHSIEREVNILGSKVDPCWNPINYISISQFHLTLNLWKLWDILLDRAFPMAELILK